MSNIAILSTAHIHTKSFLDAIAKGTDGRRVAGIWDDVEERGRRYAEQYQAPFVPRLSKLLHDKTVDGFLICAENTRHLPLLKKALPVGKPVFCEKPLTSSVRDAGKVAALLRRRPTPLFCGYFQPFSGTMQAVAGLVGENAFGRITRVRFRNAHHAAYGHWFDNPDLQWFHNPALSGGGAFMDMGTHAVHLLRTLFGPVTEVWAEIRNEAGIYPAVDDFGVAHLRFASGILGTVEAAWTQTGGIGGLEIVGAAKSLWNNGDAYVVGAPKESPQPLTPLAEKPTRVDRLVAVIRGQIAAPELESDLAAILDSVAVMEAAYASARRGKWVKVRNFVPQA
jgi:predicted dehydrogenase